MSLNSHIFQLCSQTFQSLAASSISVQRNPSNYVILIHLDDLVALNPMRTFHIWDSSVYSTHAYSSKSTNKAALASLCSGLTPPLPCLFLLLTSALNALCWSHESPLLLSTTGTWHTLFPGSENKLHHLSSFPSLFENFSYSNADQMFFWGTFPKLDHFPWKVKKHCLISPSFTSQKWRAPSTWFSDSIWILILTL